MTKFIKLTEANEAATVMLINTAHIVAMFVGKSGKDTFVRMSSNTPNRDGVLKSDYYFVRETIPQIEEMMG